MVSRSSEMARVEFRPVPRVDQRLDVILVLEARHRVVGLLFEEGARNASRLLRLEQRQAAAMDEIVDEGGDEDRLAGAGQPGHAEPERRREQRGGAARQRVEGDPRLVGESGQRGRQKTLPSAFERPI